VNPVSTLISSKLSNFQMYGERTCETCGSIVPIIKVKTEHREEEVSECLKCDTNKIQKDLQDQFNHLEKNKHVSLFNKFSMIPEDIKFARFSNYKPDDPTKHNAKSTAMRYVKHFQKVMNKELEFHSLLFQGSYGLGKSHLAHSIANELINKGYTVLFIDVPQLLQLFRENIRSKETDESQLMKALADCDLLILDDLGAEYIKKDEGRESWAVDKLFQVFTVRNNKPKIITTNYTSGGLEEKYGILAGGRIVSRMMMGTKPINFTGKDFRLNGF
jgi:DNA replication protein DnaC